MPTRLVALGDGADIPLDRAMIVVGRHPQCDARLDSIRISRRHCCMTPDNGEVIVRDLGSTNGIRINDQRVEMGRLRAGDVLSIAHLRYRLEIGEGFQDQTLADNREVRDRLLGGAVQSPVLGSGSLSIPVVTGHPPVVVTGSGAVGGIEADNPLAARVRDALVRELGPSPLGERCQIQVILQVKSDEEPSGHEGLRPCPSNSSP